MISRVFLKQTPDHALVLRAMPLGFALEELDAVPG
jgi:hypothetical protein